MINLYSLTPFIPVSKISLTLSTQIILQFGLRKNMVCTDAHFTLQLTEKNVLSMTNSMLPS